MVTGTATQPKVVTREEWLAARLELLAKEKRLTRERDALSEERRRLPWVRVEESYAFDAPDGTKTLADLFDGRSQLVIEHFMMGPSWVEGCVGCSFTVDQLVPAVEHLRHHDVSFALVARAPIAEIEAFRKRMGWPLTWVSSSGNDFNYDYGVSFRKDEVRDGKVPYNYQMQDFLSEETSGFSVFVKGADGAIYHTYSCYARGGEGVLTAYALLDMTPVGRNENGPTRTLADWVRHRDRYDAGGHVAPSGRYVAPEKAESPCGCHKS